MTKPHKHAAVIHAFADGHPIEAKLAGTQPWMDCPAPGWHEDWEYRIKPAAPVIETKMSKKALKTAFHSGGGWKGIATAAINRAVADGQVVPVVPAGMSDAEFRLGVNRLAAKIVSGEVPLVASTEEIRSAERAKRDMAVALAAYNLAFKPCSDNSAVGLKERLSDLIAKVKP